MTEDALRAALPRAWGPGSSTLYSPDNPARGQCGVTALIVHDHLGGEILKTRWRDIWHFYNQVDGRRLDFTDSQFDAPIAYDDLPSSQEEAFGDTDADQVAALHAALAALR